MHLRRPIPGAAVAALACTLLLACGSDDEPASTRAETTTGTGTTTTEAETTETGTSTERTTTTAKPPKKGCRIVPTQLPEDAEYRDAGDDPIEVEAPKAKIKTEVTPDSATMQRKIGKKGSDDGQAVAKRGTFLVVRFELKNTGKEPVAPSVIAERFVVRSDDEVYAGPRGCTAAGLYAVSRDPNPPGREVAAGKTATAVAVYVVPKDLEDAVWVGRGTSRQAELELS